MSELVRRLSVPPWPVTDATLRPLDEVVAEWREAYVAGDEARPCECGGVVIANPADPEPGVRAHRATDRHRAWAEGRYE